jgi:hypothetical protein
VTDIDINIKVDSDRVEIFSVSGIFRATITKDIIPTIVSSHSTRKCLRNSQYSSRYLSHDSYHLDERYPGSSVTPTCWSSIFQWRGRELPHPHGLSKLLLNVGDEHEIFVTVDFINISIADR